jgi:hypothetical protein
MLKKVARALTEKATEVAIVSYDEKSKIQAVIIPREFPKRDEPGSRINSRTASNSPFTPKRSSWLSSLRVFFQARRSVPRHIRVETKQEFKDRHHGCHGIFQSGARRSHLDLRLKRRLDAIRFSGTVI